MFVCLFVGLFVGFAFVGCFEVGGGFVVLRFVCVLLMIFRLVGFVDLFGRWVLFVFCVVVRCVGCCLCIVWFSLLVGFCVRGGLFVMSYAFGVITIVVGWF